jgi:alpha-tubulin suppressor-like RCC1 family protein
MECWGDNFDFQLATGTPTLPPSGQFFSIVVNPKHPLLTGKGVSIAAAGDTNSCAQNSDDDTICWGSASHFNPTGNAGFIALHSSFATTLATDADTCVLAGSVLVPCARTCLTGLVGDLFCGQWSSFGNPPPLTKIPPPSELHYVTFAQVDVGPHHVCAVTNHRDIYCFGLNERGQFGTGDVSSVRTESPVTAVRRM